MPWEHDHECSNHSIPMTFLRSICWLICFAFAGCRMAIVPMPNGKTAFVGSLLTDPHWTKAEIRPDGSVVLTGYDSKVNDAAVGKITEGVVRGITKSIIPLP